MNKIHFNILYDSHIIEHRDSEDDLGIIKVGQVQYMSAGDGL